MTEPEDWTATLTDARPIGTPVADPQAWARAVNALGDATEAIRELGRNAVPGAQDRLEQLQPEHVAAMVAQVQDVRTDLRNVEADLSRLLGRDDTTLREGVLPDGRTWTVRKGDTRKAWRHDEWKHDVRRALVARFVEDGDVDALVVGLQEVHGSAAPRSKALRQLGLDPDEYAERVPGSWAVVVSPRADA